MCSRRIIVYTVNKEMNIWTYSSKQQEYPPETTKTKEDIHLEQMKRTVKRAALK